MAVSRRRFLQQSALTAAACVAVPFEGWGQRQRGANEENAPEHNLLPGQSGQPHGDALQHLSRPQFEDVVGSGFKVSLTDNDPNPQWLRLIKVEDLPALVPVNPASMTVPPPKTSGAITVTSGFILSFTGAAAKALNQGTYIFEHDKLGRFSLLIVPNGKGEQSYTAVINRITQVSAPVASGGNASAGNPLPTPAEAGPIFHAQTGSAGQMMNQNDNGAQVRFDRRMPE